ncbi:HSP20 family protein [Kribbella sp. VKM Ac-2569]|uniref:Hsp20/alpha crystallin family protein n=1 Tax=Kribbella sp. VKM Ac-2569 TaxID=2512220 RepID=UPI00102B4F30|nr:Hsp20/alpha crystallin family protein [Kribbella sp. VKM Ac-2569]RZT16893.1 HSP20 family protein [Kribbella sp. VKM Ac-2569]
MERPLHPVRPGSGQDGQRDQLGPRRWLPSEPFAHLEDIYRRMNQMMRNLADDVDLRSWRSPVDIEETDDAYLVEIDLPGVPRDTLVLEWNDRQLTLHGEVKDRERIGILHQQARRTGPFDHTITLPGAVDGETIEATLTNGVLTIHAPKAQAAEGRRIDIKDSISDAPPAPSSTDTTKPTEGDAPTDPPSAV